MLTLQKKNEFEIFFILKAGGAGKFLCEDEQASLFNHLQGRKRLIRYGLRSDYIFRKCYHERERDG